MAGKAANGRCGAFFGHQPATKSTVKPASEWNRMTLTAQGPTITVVLNGEVVNAIDLTQWKDSKLIPDSSEMPKWLQRKPWAEMPHKGRISFQSRHAVAGIEFRKVKQLLLW
jgi:hypothetical protein